MGQAPESSLYQEFCSIQDLKFFLKNVYEVLEWRQLKEQHIQRTQSGQGCTQMHGQAGDPDSVKKGWLFFCTVQATWSKGNKAVSILTLRSAESQCRTFTHSTDFHSSCPDGQNICKILHRQSEQHSLIHSSAEAHTVRKTASHSGPWLVSIKTSSPLGFRKCLSLSSLPEPWNTG